jgi:hypothetical protein
MMASRDPLASLTTVAVTPRLLPSLPVAELIAEARSFNVLTPLPVVMVEDSPLALVRVKEVAGRAAVGLASRSEYQAPVVARLLTTTLCVPATVPLAAVALTALDNDDVTVRAESGPLSVLSACMSLETACVAVCIAVSAVVWLLREVISVFQTFSGARAAAMAAATAWVTSIPAVADPELAARMELMSTAELVVEEEEPRSELTEDTELMMRSLLKALPAECCWSPEEKRRWRHRTPPPWFLTLTGPA